MLRGLPGLGFLLVTFSAGIGTDNLGRIGRNCALCSQTEDHQQAAETKAEDRQQAAETDHGRPEMGPWSEPDQPKAVRSKNDNGSSPLLQPSHTPASAVLAGCGGDRQQAGPSAGR